MIKNKLLIELKNVGVYNKGGYLMLLAVKNEFKRRGYADKVLFCGEHGPGRSYFSLGANNMYQIPKSGRRNYPFLNVMLPLFPEKLRHDMGLVLPDEVDHIIDGAGFGYGDIWGTTKPTSLALKACKRVKKKGGKVILLPQALGPFERTDVRKNFRQLVDFADLICARDTVSFQHLTDTYGTDDRFVLFPDFTNLLDVPEAVEYREGNVCIIPNEKMLKVEGADPEKYYEWLAQTVRRITSQGHTPYWLVHEGEGDRRIVEIVNERLENSLPIVDHPDPLHLKHRIKSARFIVVSRFHGLVSALSQGIPAITSSWSHKYRMVAREYGVENFLVNVYDKDAINHTDELLSILGDETKYHQLTENVASRANEEKKRSRKMWDKVFSLLDTGLKATQ